MRKLTLGDNIIWEPLLSLSDETHSVSYGMLPPSEDRPLKYSPFPTFPYHYNATIRLRPVTEGTEGTFIDYTATFAAESGLAYATEGALSNIFKSGFAELRKQFG